MQGIMKIMPGEPNDQNRDYLPEAIKGSRMVVNENGNNSQVYPERLEEFHGDLVGDGIEDTWYEYVPESYDPGRKTPLVFSMHGGLMTGWGQCIYTCWTQVADREGFILVFPSAGTRRFWQLECEPERKKELTTPNESGFFMNAFPDDIRENHDANLVLALIRRMKERYAIDEGRMYMQGMSMGNGMTAMMAKYYAHLFAGMAGSAGTSRKTQFFHPDGSVTHQSLPVAAWQTRMELDGPPPFSDEDYEEAVVHNRRYWLTVNECTELPRIRVEGEKNLAYYHGKKADYVFCDVKNRDHGQTLDDAEWVWDNLFSAARRMPDGSIRMEPQKDGFQPNAFSAALAEGQAAAWLNGEVIALAGRVFTWKKLKYHGLNGGEIVRGTYLMAPVSFLARAAGGTLKTETDGAVAEIALPDGRKLQTARGSIGMVIDNRMRAMDCEAVMRDGELYLPAAWFFRMILGRQVSECRGVLYAAECYGELSMHMARLLRDLLS
ncbi:MAG: hypothetical protein IJ231_02410 [Clostridia bacterium]|nr:hypothetical protein [Clostridia bacterium]